MRCVRLGPTDRAIAFDIIENHVALPPSQRPEKTPLFFIFHFLGEWREVSAYRPLLRLLRLPEPENIWS